MSGAASRPAAPTRSWVRFVAVRAGGLVAIVLALRWTAVAESAFFYFPSREAFITSAGVEDVTITTPDGVRLHGWFMAAAGAAPGEKRPAILHVHGNAGNVDSHEAFSAFLAEAGFHVLLFDYRGYGRSDPARMLNREKLMTDTRAALAALASRPDVDASRLGVYGVSLGGVFASRLAAEDPSIDAVCLVSAFSSWARIAHTHAPVLGPILVSTGLDPAQSVAKLKAPLLLVHATVDEVVPPEHSDHLEDAARAAGANVTRVRMSITDHNAIVTDDPDAVAEIIGFFERAFTHTAR